MRPSLRNTFFACLTVAVAFSSYAWSAEKTPKSQEGDAVLSDVSVNEVTKLTHELIDAENAHDISRVEPMLWVSPNMLFVAKTATPDQGNWAGFWGTDVVLKHFQDLYKGTFHMAPDYAKERIAGVTSEVAETYLPLEISVSYAGQAPVPKPFILVLVWVNTAQGWRLASDVALPVPPPPAHT